MNLGLLEFTPEQLIGEFSYLRPRAQADFLNRILSEKLEKASVYYSAGGFDCWHLTESLDDDHTARLVCIEEVPHG